jgi:hypothetical protein
MLAIQNADTWGSGDSELHNTLSLMWLVSGDLSDVLINVFGSPHSQIIEYIIKICQK